MSDDLKIRVPEWARNMYNRLLAKIDAGGGGGGGGGDVTGVKGDAESTYRQGNVNLTPANIGALPDSTPIPSKTSDLTNDSGFLTSSTGATGVKGNAENAYRQGNVNLTPANIGAVAKSGDTMTGNLTVGQTSDTAERTVKAVSAAGAIYLYSQETNTGNRGIYAANAAGTGKGVLYVTPNNDVVLQGRADENVLKSGDTMTGTLTAPAFSGPLTGNVTGHASDDLALSGGDMTGNVRQIMTGVTRGSPPDDNQYRAYEFIDNGGKRVGLLEYSMQTTGDSRMHLYVLGNTSTGTNNEYGGLIIYKTVGVSGNKNCIFNANTGEFSATKLTGSVAAGNITGTVAVDHGGTGAITPAGARANLDITPANIGAVSTTDIINNLTSTATDKPLSAAQGKVLFDEYYTGRIMSQWVTCSYLNSNQLHGFFTKPTAPTGYTLRACFASNLFPNSELGVKCSGGFLIGDNYLRVRGSGFTTTDTIDALLCWMVIKI